MGQAKSVQHNCDIHRFIELQTYWAILTMTVIAECKLIRQPLGLALGQRILVLGAGSQIILSRPSAARALERIWSVMPQAYAVSQLRSVYAVAMR